MANETVNIKEIALQTGSDNTVYATWAMKNSKYVQYVDYYIVKWYYTTGDGVLFSGSSSNVTATNATYSYPSNANKVKVAVHPVSKTYTKNGVTTKYFIGESTSKVYYIEEDDEPEQPSAPSVTVSDYTLTVSLDTYDENTERVEFYIVNINKETLNTGHYETGYSTVTANRAVYQTEIKDGYTYRVRCRGINSDWEEGEWSEYSSDVEASAVLPEQPSAPTVSIDEFTLTAYVDTYDDYTDSIEFFIAKTNKETGNSGVEWREEVDLSANRATLKYDIHSTYTYKVKCRGYSEEYSRYGEWSEWSGDVSAAPNYPEQPSAPTVSVDRYTATVTVDTYDDYTEQIQFRVIRAKDGSTAESLCFEDTISVSKQRATLIFTLDTGYTYRVRCRGYRCETTWYKDLYGEWSEYSDEFVATPYSGKYVPEQPSAPTVTLDGYTLTASLDTYDDNTDYVEFAVIQDSKNFIKLNAQVVNNRASASCAVSAGYTYRVKCRGTNSSYGIDGEWSEYSSDVETIPNAVADVTCAAESETVVKVTWTGTTTATSYEVEYATSDTYFDQSSDTQTVTVTANTAYVTGLDSGEKWYFRVRAVNKQGESEWSSVVSTVIGSTPSAPTTWASKTTAIVGDTINLYWTHNTEDSSEQQAAQVMVTVNGVSTTTDISDNTTSYTLDLSSYTAGALILWKVRTCGITGEYSEWSIQRTINVYAPAVLGINLSTEILEAYPLTIDLTAGPTTQTAISYYISIISVNSYDTVNESGETVHVRAGDEVYSYNFNSSSNEVTVELSAGDVILGSGQTYQVVATVAMNSGLTAEASDSFTVSWTGNEYEPNASIGYDPDTLCCYISPYCWDIDGELVSNVVLSVYRREYDGTLTEIITNLANDGIVTVTDPHPALDYARYRIVAREKDTNVLSYEDLPGYEIHEPSIVIQWNDTWSNYDYSEEAEAEEPPWSGSLVKLPYNVDVTENYDPDVTLLEYVGRSYPTSYYGTQRGETASWSTEVPVEDKDTIYALRRLAKYTGDVYVREPSGTGYYANIKVSMATKHCQLVVPVSFEITRVDKEESVSG